MGSDEGDEDDGDEADEADGDGDDIAEDKSDRELGIAMATGCHLSDHGDNSNTPGCSHDNSVAHSDRVVICTSENDTATAHRHNDKDGDTVDSATESPSSDTVATYNDNEPTSDGMTTILSKNPSGNIDADTSSDDDNDDAPALVSIGALNKSTQPFRDTTHVDSQRDTSDDDRRFEDESKPLGMDPRLVKKKMRSQMQRKNARLLARRTRKHGEAALATKLRRENTDDIKQSLGPIWY